MRVSKLLCYLGIHAWKVERRGEVPGAHVEQRYCSRCKQEVVEYKVYDFFEWEDWIREATDNQLEEEAWRLSSSIS